MPPTDASPFLDTVLTHARRDLPRLRHDMLVEEALRVIREEGTSERIIYFYVVDTEERLSGVLPTRRLLTAQPHSRLDEVMIRRVLALPQTATMLDACELFVMHKFLAFPIVDADRRVVGVIDISACTEEMLGLPEPEKPDELFEILGLRLSQLRGASPWKAFLGRFPWLLTTIASGTLAAVLAGIFEKTMTEHMVIAFFLAMVLALAEAVSMQSMTLTLQALRSTQLTARWFWRTARREASTSLLLGLACGSVVFMITWLWRGEIAPATVIGVSVAGGLVIACFAGLTMPSLLHALKLDPKIAAGPAALAVADIGTLLLYLSLATWIL